VAGFIEKNTAAAAQMLERTVASERWSSAPGFLQAADPRLKIASFLALVLACSLARGIMVLACLYALATALACLSKIAVSDFTRRVWIFVPLFTAVVAIPALFITPGAPIASLGPFAITDTGARSALMLVLRVSASVSFSLLIILTTPWNRLLDALRSMRLPGIVVSLLALSYRYMLLLLRTASELFLARKSRVIAALPFKKEAAFISRSAGYLFLRSLHLAEGVHMAMVSRGWEDDERIAGAEPHDSSGGTVFELTRISYAYPGDIPGLAVDRLDVPRGRCTMLLGPNGSGKSTLLKILDGLIYPQTGSVMAFGKELSEKALEDARFRRSFRGSVGLVFQDADVQCFSPTVREELAFGPRQKGLGEDEISRRVEEALALLRIALLADRYPYTLSGGEKKRVALASILTLDLDVYLLDEPTTNLDPATEGILIDILSGLADRGKTLVVATQDLMLARHIGDTAVILGNGKQPLFIGPAAEALENAELLERAGLAHAHRLPHGETAAGFRHSHFTEDKGK
jgi:cobalt ECF transporter T component CbiQ